MKSKKTYISSFWNKTNKNYEMFEYMLERVVPTFGESCLFHGEFLRSLARIHYDIYNNGFLNANMMKDFCLFIVKNFNDMNNHFGTHDEDLEAFKELSVFNEEKDEIPFLNKNIVEALDRTIEKAIFWCEYEENKKVFDDIGETPLSLMVNKT